jgi:hypothetical protein
VNVDPRHATISASTFAGRSRRDRPAELRPVLQEILQVQDIRVVERRPPNHRSSEER